MDSLEKSMKKWKKSSTKKWKSAVNVNNNKIQDLSHNVSSLAEKDDEIQQSVTDLLSAVQKDVTELAEEDAEIQRGLTDLSSQEQTDYKELEEDINALNNTVIEN